MNKKMMLTFAAACGALALWAGEAVVADMEKSIYLDKVNFWADGPTPSFKLLGPAEAAQGKSAMKVFFYPVKGYCDFGFGPVTLPAGANGITYLYKDVEGQPPAILNLRVLDPKGRVLASYRKGVKWAPAKTWTRVTVPFAEFKLERDKGGKLVAGSRLLVLFNYTSKKAGASVKLDDVAFTLEGGKTTPICDFEKFHAARWNPAGVWMWADGKSSNPVAELLCGPEAAKGNVSLQFTFSDCQSYQGIAFYRGAKLPADPQNLSFLYRVTSGKFPAKIVINHYTLPNQRGVIRYEYAKKFACASDGKWHAAELALTDFKLVKKNKDAQCDHTGLRAGDLAGVQFDGKAKEAGVFALDDIKFTGR